MSRKYNAATRLLNAYGKYTEQLAKRTAIWAKKGYTPVDPTALSFEDFVANREYLKSRGIAAGNVTRTIISQQLYAFNQSQAEALIKELAGMGITSIKGKKLSLIFHMLSNSEGLASGRRAGINNRFTCFGAQHHSTLIAGQILNMKKSVIKCP